MKDSKKEMYRSDFYNKSCTTCIKIKPRLCNRIRNEAIKHKEIGGYAKKHSTSLYGDAQNQSEASISQ
ncbi:MAG: hypothetical protein OEW67_01690 [Cyclobacteriaceae bacterium]|nr:hypothetical protein [Cyclobacteriaceae bacterium]